MPKQAAWLLILMTISMKLCAGIYSSSSKQPNRQGLLLATSAAVSGVPQQHSTPLRKLLRNGEEDYAHAVGASRFMYRFISGTWLQFDSIAGYPGSTNKQICAKARMANACSKQQPDKLGLREWPGEDDKSLQGAVAEMAAASAAVDQATKLQSTTPRGEVAPRG